MSKTIEIIEPGCEAETVHGNLKGFITMVKIGKGAVIYYEFSYFCNDGYRQTWLEEFEFKVSIAKKIKIGFKQ